MPSSGERRPVVTTGTMQTKEGRTMYRMRGERAELVDMSAEELPAYWLFGAVQRPQYDPLPDESVALYPHEPVLAANLVLSVRIRGVFSSSAAAAAPADLGGEQ